MPAIKLIRNILSRGLLYTQYVTVEHKTDKEKLWRFMKDCWKLPQPTIVISVTGGANLSLTPKLKKSFKEGLTNVASSTGELKLTYYICMLFVY